MRSTQNLSPKNGIDLGTTSGVVEIDASKANVWELVANGNVTLDITNLPPGQSLSILFAQDGVGGRTVGFSGMTIESADATQLIPVATASAKTQWEFIGVSQAAGAGVCRLVSSTVVGNGIVTSVTGSNHAVVTNPSPGVFNVATDGTAADAALTLLARDALGLSALTTLTLNILGGASQGSLSTDGAGTVALAPAGATTSIAVGGNALGALHLNSNNTTLEAAGVRQVIVQAGVTFFCSTGGATLLTWDGGGQQLNFDGCRYSSTPVNSAVTTGAQSISIAHTNALTINAALTGDTAVNITGMDATRAQPFTLTYSPATNHLTITNNPITDATTLTAIATAEGSANFITLSLTTIGPRILLTAWAQA